MLFARVFLTIGLILMGWTPITCASVSTIWQRRRYRIRSTGDETDRDGPYSVQTVWTSSFSGSLLRITDAFMAKTALKFSLAARGDGGGALKTLLGALSRMLTPRGHNMLRKSKQQTARCRSSSVRCPLLSLMWISPMFMSKKIVQKFTLISGSVRLYTASQSHEVLVEVQTNQSGGKQQEVQLSNQGRR